MIPKSSFLTNQPTLTPPLKIPTKTYAAIKFNQPNAINPIKTDLKHSNFPQNIINFHKNMSSWIPYCQSKEVRHFLAAEGVNTTAIACVEEEEPDPTLLLIFVVTATVSIILISVFHRIYQWRAQKKRVAPILSLNYQI